MKRIIAIITALFLFTLTFAGCGDKETKTEQENTRVLFNLDLSKYITLGDYKNIPVDTSSDTFKGYYDDVIESHVENYGLAVKVTEGTVKEGDTANIDYVGKKDGVAFEGGTAQGYDLEIGSNTFIDGFEEGLVGVKIGDTVDLNLTFPENYSSADLAGADVVFTVTVNYVKSDEAPDPKDYYSELNYETLEAYETEVTKLAAKNYLLDAVMANSEIKNYPKTEKNKFYKDYKSNAETSLKSNNMTLEQYLTNNGMTEEDFKEDAMTNQIEPMLEQLMLVYAIADSESIALDESAVDTQLDKMVLQYKESGQEITAEEIDEYYTSNYGDYYLEYVTAYENVIELIYDNADIK